MGPGAAPLKWMRTRSPLALRRQLRQSLRTSSTVGSSCSLYRARGCQRSYCAWSALPIESSAFCGCMLLGSIQHSARAQGDTWGGLEAGRGAVREEF